MTQDGSTQVKMQNVQDVVPETTMAGFCVLDKDIAAGTNPKYIPTGWDLTQADQVAPDAVDIPVIMSRLSDVNGEEPGYFVTANYINALKASGARPIFIDYNQDPEELASKYPGALLIGGFAEFPDKWYGENPTSPYKDKTENPVNAKRADFETKVLAAFMKKKKPVLGICNGMQVMAASHGATLTGSIKDSFPDAANHCGADAAHPIDIVENTRLSEIFSDRNGQPIEMTSFHNEAVMAVPKDGDITVNARSTDGIIEGIELKGGHSFTIGVQGHPEHYSAGVREGDGKAIISAFVAECALD